MDLLKQVRMRLGEERHKSCRDWNWRFAWGFNRGGNKPGPGRFNLPSINEFSTALDV